MGVQLHQPTVNRSVTNSAPVLPPVADETRLLFAETARQLGLRTNSRLRGRKATGGMLPIDARTRIGKDVAMMREALAAHVGKGRPLTAPQQALIDRAVQLRLRLAIMDQAYVADGAFLTGHDSRQYLAWSNSLCRLFAQLGVVPNGEPSRDGRGDMASYLAGLSADDAGGDGHAGSRRSRSRPRSDRRPVP